MTFKLNERSITTIEVLVIIIVVGVLFTLGYLLASIL